MNELNDFIDLYSDDDGATGEHPKFSFIEWKREVICLDTRLGYWEWCYNREMNDTGR